MATIQLRVEGDNARQSALALQQFINDEWGIAASVTSPAPAKGDGNKDLTTVLALMKFIIELPKFLDAVDDLARRMQARERLERLMAKVQELADPTQTFWIEVNGVPFALKTENLVDILNKLQE